MQRNRVHSAAIGCGTVKCEESWQLSGLLQLDETLRVTVPRSPSLLRLGKRTAAYSQWTDAGPATVSLAVWSGRLRATATGPGAVPALAAVPRTVGLDDEPESFQPTPGLMRDLHLRNPGFRLGASGRVFDTILPMIIGQRVTTDEARRSYLRLVDMTGELAPGELGLRLPPRPKAILGLDQAALHMLGIENARARVIREAARRASRLEEISTMDRTAAAARIGALPGVGPWTVAHVMGSAWGDRDAVVFGDFHLPNLVAWALAHEPRATDQRMAELLEPFRPQRRRAQLLIKLSGIHAPRYGPRSGKSIISRG